MSNETPKGTVLITGASTGIGKACALRLAERGYHVFAGVRKPADGRSLESAARGKLTPIILDVTNQEHIAEAVQRIEEATAGKGLTALVNNAGIGITGPSELLPIETFRRQFEINFFAQVALTQAFLPLIRTAAGRIINMGSIGNRVTLPFGGPLNSSKWAFASWNHALRIELRPWGIRVILIEPASIKTEAPDKMIAEAEEALEQIGPRGRAMYGEAHRSFIHNFTKHPKKMGTSPDVVAKYVIKSIELDRPRTRYLVGASARPLAFIARFMPDTVFDRIRLLVFQQPKAFGNRRYESIPLPQTGGAAPVTMNGHAEDESAVEAVASAAWPKG